MLRCVLAVALSACTFEPAPFDEAHPGVDGGSSTPTVRCDSASGAVLCLDFEDVADPMPAKVLDSSGGGHDATPLESNPTVHRQGAFDEQAIQLNELGSRLDVMPAPAFDIKDEVTMELWFRHDAGPPPLSSTRHWLVDHAGQYFMSIGNDQQVRCGFNDDTTVDSNIPIQTSLTLWQHVACTIRSIGGGDTEIRVYIDGELSDCEIVSDTIAPRPGGMTIGMKGAPASIGDQFVGSLDNVHVYHRTASATEICAAAGKTGCNDQCPGGGGGSGSGSGEE